MFTMVGPIHHRRSTCPAPTSSEGGGGGGRVAKPKNKIPRITFAAPIAFALADEEWNEIEKAFDRVLDTQTRQEILNVTREFLQFAEAETKTGLMSDAVRRTERQRAADPASRLVFFYHLLVKKPL
jgi:hypothetical protein